MKVNFLKNSKYKTPVSNLINKKIYALNFKRKTIRDKFFHYEN